MAGKATHGVTQTGRPSHQLLTGRVILGGAIHGMVIPGSLTHGEATVDGTTGSLIPGTSGGGILAPIAAATRGTWTTIGKGLLTVTIEILTIKMATAPALMVAATKDT